jgi:hypothetical protein
MQVEVGSEKPVFVPKKLTILFETETEFDVFVTLMGATESAPKAVLGNNHTLKGRLSQMMFDIYHEMLKP